MLKEIVQNTTIPIKAGENELKISFDLNAFFSGVDLAVQIDTHTGNNLPLAQLLHSNLESAIQFK